MRGSDRAPDAWTSIRMIVVLQLFHMEKAAVKRAYSYAKRLPERFDLFIDGAVHLGIYRAKSVQKEAGS